MLTASLGEQAERQRAAEPVRLFVETLGEALASGRAHVRRPRGRTCRRGTRRCWAGGGSRSSRAGSSAGSGGRAHGEHVGWTDGERLYLNPPVAYADVSRLLAEQGTELPKRPATLWGEPYVAGWIAMADQKQGQGRATFKKRIGGVPKSTLVLRVAEVVEGCGKPERDNVPFAA